MLRIRATGSCDKTSTVATVMYNGYDYGTITVQDHGPLRSESGGPILLGMVGAADAWTGLDVRQSHLLSLLF